MLHNEYVVESVSVQSRISLPRFLRKRRTWGVLNGSFRVHAKVIKDIDLMIKNLRDEEKADIEHRDWCESERKSAEFKNENLQYDQEQLTQKIERAEGQKAELEEEVQKTNTEKNETLALMEDAKMTRIAENSAFQQALKDAAYVFF